jgi:hypothetical protein
MTPEERSAIHAAHRADAVRLLRLTVALVYQLDSSIEELLCTLDTPYYDASPARVRGIILDIAEAGSLEHLAAIDLDLLTDNLDQPDEDLDLAEDQEGG